MSAGLDLQPLFALTIVIGSLSLFGWLVWTKVTALGLFREDFDRRAPWLAVGTIIGGAVLYFVKH